MYRALCVCEEYAITISMCRATNTAYAIMDCLTSRSAHTKKDFFFPTKLILSLSSGLLSLHMSWYWGNISVIVSGIYLRRNSHGTTIMFSQAWPDKSPTQFLQCWLVQGNDHSRHELHLCRLHKLELSALVTMLWLGLQPSQSGMRCTLQAA